MFFGNVCFSPVTILRYYGKMLTLTIILTLTSLNSNVSIFFWIYYGYFWISPVSRAATEHEVNERNVSMT